MTPEQLLAEGAVACGQRVVSSAYPAASTAGITAYAQGGNAFDAALAACFMETVALPMKCGLAGDLVALFRVRGGALQSLVSVGHGCAALAEGERLERLGPRSVGIPGAPDGYATLGTFGRLRADKLIDPAVRAAYSGIPWTRPALSYLEESRELLARYNHHTPYLPKGRMPELGEVRRLPGLGHILERFALYGADLFAHEDGERLVQAVRSRGGFIRSEDLCGRHAQVSNVISVDLDANHRLFATPGPTGGPRLLDIMRDALAEKRDLLQVVQEERKRAKARNLLATADGTSVVTAADKEGNAVVVVHSNSFPRFGSGVVLEDGLVLNNRPGRGFDLDAPAEASNAPKAGRVPQTTLHAWALLRNETMFMGATPGGVNQLPWNAQTLTSLLAGGKIGEMVCDPRWALDEAGRLTSEAGALDSEIEPAQPRFNQRSAQQILELNDAGLQLVAADPRTGALALATY